MSISLVLFFVCVSVCVVGNAINICAKHETFGAQPALSSWFSWSVFLPYFYFIRKHPNRIKQFRWKMCWVTRQSCEKKTSSSIIRYLVLDACCTWDGIRSNKVRKCVIILGETIAAKHLMHACLWKLWICYLKVLKMCPAKSSGCWVSMTIGLQHLFKNCSTNIRLI